MERYLCVHGHFYQPPRENPWLETVEMQDSAYPHHDWNERITAECYAPMGAARMLDAEGRITRIINNYARMSFNVGPTLLSWMAAANPRAYAAILEADRESQRRFSGHGSAMAQVYNHMILPLANHRDRRTQIRWGLRDFKSRFGRDPEGMWLAECAADLESLDMLAEHGIRFTVLAPGQARRARRPGARAWREVNGGQIDPSMPYQVALPSGRRIAVFFYDGPVSQAVAFEGILRDGVRFTERLLGAYSDDRPWPQLLHIATDDETYGHHHAHGDMALAQALTRIEEGSVARLTNYGEFLALHPPAAWAEIHEKSSWSCVHGVDRWWKDCGCNSGGRADWNQAWRTPLRDALDWLRDVLAPAFEEEGRRHLRDPWAARDDYIDIVLDRSPESQERFFARHAADGLRGEDRPRALMLLEMQRHAMLMYTSCGWFFDDLSGIETVQVIAYAGRAVQLARAVLGRDLEAEFLDKLAHATSNLPQHGDGAAIYRKFVKPASVDLGKVAAHYAISGLFETYADRSRVYCYLVEREHAARVDVGRSSLLVGRARITSEVTHQSSHISYGILHLGDHNLQCGVRPFQGEEAYADLVREASDAFHRGEFTEVVRLLDRHFGGVTYSLKSLFRDEQRKVVRQILESTLDEVEGSLRRIYEHHAQLMRFLVDIGTPPPRALYAAAEFTLNTSLRRALDDETPDTERIRSLLDSAKRENVPLDGPGLGYALEQAIDRLMQRLEEDPADADRLRRVESWSAFSRPHRLSSTSGRPRTSATTSSWRSIPRSSTARMRQRASGWGSSPLSRPG